MSHIKFDYSKVLDKFVAPHEVEYMQSQVTAADELIQEIRPSKQLSLSMSTALSVCSGIQSFWLMKKMAI